MMCAMTIRCPSPTAPPGYRRILALLVWLLATSACSGGTTHIREPNRIASSRDWPPSGDKYDGKRADESHEEELYLDALRESDLVFTAIVNALEPGASGRANDSPIAYLVRVENVQFHRGRRADTARHAYLECPEVGATCTLVLLYSPYPVATGDGGSSEPAPNLSPGERILVVWPRTDMNLPTYFPWTERRVRHASDGSGETPGMP